MSPLVNVILVQLLAKAKELGLAWFDKGAQLALDGLSGEVPDEAVLAWLRSQAEVKS